MCLHTAHDSVLVSERWGRRGLVRCADRADVERRERQSATISWLEWSGRTKATIAAGASVSVAVSSGSADVVASAADVRGVRLTLFRVRRRNGVSTSSGSCTSSFPLGASLSFDAGAAAVTGGEEAAFALAARVRFGVGWLDKSGYSLRISFSSEQIESRLHVSVCSVSAEGGAEELDVGGDGRSSRSTTEALARDGDTGADDEDDEDEDEDDER